MEINLLGVKIVITLPSRSLGMLILLLGIVTVSYLLMTKMRKERVLKFANFYTLRKIHGYKSIVPSIWILLIKLFIVTLLFLVATDSIEISMVRPVANTDFCIAIDVSQTMLLPDYSPNRLEFVKKTVENWLDELPGASKICVLKFADSASPVVPLTGDIFKIRKKIEKISITPNNTGTALGEAIVLGSSMLAQSDKQRFLILITDGKNNAGRSLEEALKIAREKNVIIYAIGIGLTNETRKIYEQLAEIARKRGIKFNFPELDTEQLKMIARETGGKFFFVTNEKAFEESMKNVLVKNERIPLNSDYYVLLFISLLVALELLVFSKFGAV